jgi:hypothetical protein
MFFIDTAAVLPAFFGAAGAAFWVFGLLPLLLLLPHPAATRPQATMEQNDESNRVKGPPGGIARTLAAAASADQELEQRLLGVEPVLGLVPDG